MKNSIQELDRRDVSIAILCGIGALVIYIRTLAPDLLYGDSAEFQTLVYSLGYTHSTGYPVYLLLARLLSFIPIGNLAWRVSLFSALSAAVTVGCVYLLARFFTTSRAGALLGSITLILSYTFWSQAVIAEVYTPGMAFLGLILVLVMHWKGSPFERLWLLFSAAALAGLALGVHATTALLAPVAAVYVVASMIAMRATWHEWRRILFFAGAGALAGILGWLVASLYIDFHNPPSSFFNVMLYPSRSIWGLTPSNMDTPFERIWLTVSAVQWRSVLFQGGSEAATDALVGYLVGFIGREFSIPLFFLSFYGWWEMFRRRPGAAGYLLASTLFVLFYVLNYHPGDQYVFFLPTYVTMAAASGVALGVFLEWIQKRVKPSMRKEVQILVFSLLVVLIIQPSWQSRWQAVKEGAATFVTENYAYPVQDLSEPRDLTGLVLSEIPSHSVLLMDFRTLYAAYYLAQIEGKKPDIRILEAMPAGNNGRVAESLVGEIKDALDQGWGVYADSRYEGLSDSFRLRHVGTSRWSQVLPKE